MDTFASRRRDAWLCLSGFHGRHEPAGVHNRLRTGQRQAPGSGLSRVGSLLVGVVSNLLRPAVALRANTEHKIVASAAVPCLTAVSCASHVPVAAPDAPTGSEPDASATTSRGSGEATAADAAPDAPTSPAGALPAVEATVSPASTGSASTTTTATPDEEPSPSLRLDPQAPADGVGFVWRRPEAGIVPAVYPLCSADQRSWDDRCVPPSVRHDSDAGQAAGTYERPRMTQRVLGFEIWCRSTVAPCDCLLSVMKWPLDYMGADPICVRNEYILRSQAHTEEPDPPAGLRGVHGWHNCVTSIDPLQRSWYLDSFNDVGKRLSDSGVSLAQRCREVLPADVELETLRQWLSVSDGLLSEPQRFGNDCDAWAAHIQADPAVGLYPQCFMSSRLAEEWMEHHYNVDELHHTPSC